MEELIEGLKKKNSEAFKEVMKMFKNRIFNYLRLLLHDDDLAEELTQDTFVKIYFKAHTLKTNNLKSWIYTIATNLARSEFRKRKLKQMLSYSEAKEAHFSYHSKIEDEILIEQMVSKLPEKYRIPLIMKELDNFSFDEISTILGKPVGTVKTLVFRGKNYLRNYMTQELSGGS